MGRHSDISNMLVSFCVDDSDFPIVLTRVFAAIPDVDELGVRFVDNAVGTGFKLDRVEKVERVRLKDPQHGVVSAGYEQLIECRDEQRSLRLLESRDASHPLTGLQINDLQRAVLQSGDE